MTHRPHRHLAAVGPNVRRLPHAAGDYERRTAALALVEPLPSALMRKAMAATAVGLAMFASALLGRAMLAPAPTVEVRPTWTEAAGFPGVERPPQATTFSGLAKQQGR